MTKNPSQKICYTSGHGPLKVSSRKDKKDDHDQDSLKKDLLHMWSWSSENTIAFCFPPCAPAFSSRPVGDGVSETLLNIDIALQEPPEILRSPGQVIGFLFSPQNNIQLAVPGTSSA